MLALSALKKGPAGNGAGPRPTFFCGAGLADADAGYIVHLCRNRPAVKALCYGEGQLIFARIQRQEQGVMQPHSTKEPVIFGEVVTAVIGAGFLLTEGRALSGRNDVWPPDNVNLWSVGLF